MIHFPASGWGAKSGATQSRGLSGTLGFGLCVLHIPNTVPAKHPDCCGWGTTFCQFVEHAEVQQCLFEKRLLGLRLVLSGHATGCFGIIGLEQVKLRVPVIKPGITKPQQTLSDFPRIRSPMINVKRPAILGFHFLTSSVEQPVCNGSLWCAEIAFVHLSRLGPFGRIS